MSLNELFVLMTDPSLSSDLSLMKFLLISRQKLFNLYTVIETISEFSQGAFLGHLEQFGYFYHDIYIREYNCLNQLYCNKIVNSSDRLCLGSALIPVLL